MNNISITGRLTADPELKQTTSGVAVCSFTLAVKRPHVADAVDFINVNTWRQSAVYISSYAHKGSIIAVCGYLIGRKWKDKNGNDRISFEVTADSAEICESRRTSPDETDKDNLSYAPAATLEDLQDDELPF